MGVPPGLSPPAFMVSPRDMEDLVTMKANRKRAGSAFEEWSAKFASQISPEAALLTDEDVVRMVHEARGETSHRR